MPPWIGEPLRGHSNAAFAVTGSPDGRRFASASADGTVRVYDLAGREKPLLLASPAREKILSLIWIDDHRLVAGGGGARWWWTDAQGLRTAVTAVDIPALTDEETRTYRHLLGR